MNKKQNIPMYLIILVVVSSFTLILGQSIISNYRLEKKCTKEIEASLIRVDEGYVYYEDFHNKTTCRKEYTGSYMYIVNDKTYSYSTKNSKYPDKQIIIKYNPDNPDEACTDVARDNTISIVVICVIWVLGGSMALFIKLSDKPKIQSNESTIENKFGGSYYDE